MQEIEINKNTWIILAVLVLFVGSLFAVAFVVKKKTNDEILGKLTVGLQQCDSFCKEGAGTQSIGVFQSFNKDGTAECFCIEMVVNDDTQHKNQLQAKDN
jgi:hypothetical protein|tara:strand:- start:2199 stop:2498 length:300 start_codon:yes stop_codon:yes gene_type:complete